MSARQTVTGERADVLDAAGGARRAATYRLIFGVCLVLAGAGAVLVYYWHRHHPEVARVAQSKTPRNASTEMHLPKLDLANLTPSGSVPTDDTPPRVTPPAPDVAGGSVAAVPALPAAARASVAGGMLPSSALHRAVSPVLLQTPAPVEMTLPQVMPTATTARAGVKVLHAQLLPSQRFLLPRGAFLDCTLETAVDSTLPGLSTCMVASDIYGADGTVVLLPRGSRLVGETHADVRAGQARVSITWTEARTPQGVYLPLGAAGTDALGRTGVPGAIDRHTTERFGAAVMLSVIDSATSALVNRRTSGTGVVYNIQGTREVATEALRQSINIPPTIRVEPGARVEVIVTTDVDFSDVYQLVARDGG